MPAPHLLALYDEAAGRAQALRDSAPGWPCQRGCDDCCLSLARMPDVGEAEWAALAAELDGLGAAARSEIAHRVAALRDADGSQGSVVCPLLDLEAGACRVYAGRPLGCRTYGYYVGRSHDAWCDKVAAHVAGNPELIRGNLTAIEQRHAAVDAPGEGLLERLHVALASETGRR